MKPNMSSADRIIRVILFATTLILFLTGILTGTLGYVLLAVASVLLLTSAINFCPLYRLVGISTCKVRS